jgi:hypothetical protein
MGYAPGKRKGNHEFLENKCASCAGETLIETGSVQIPCGVLQGVPLLSLLVCMLNPCHRTL